jgi:hypothetical protein
MPHGSGASHVQGPEANVLVLCPLVLVAAPPNAPEPLPLPVVEVVVVEPDWHAAATTNAANVSAPRLPMRRVYASRSPASTIDGDAARRYLAGMNEDPAGTEALREAIRNLNGVDSTWVEAVPVKESFQGKTVWEGAVQVFELVGHPTAKRAFAWSFATEGTKRRFVAVLQTGPATSPETAVRAAIVAEERARRN